jgi:hypothetical protein
MPSLDELAHYKDHKQKHDTEMAELKALVKTLAARITDLEKEKQQQQQRPAAAAAAAAAAPSAPRRILCSSWHEHLELRKAVFLIAGVENWCPGTDKSICSTLYKLDYVQRGDVATPYTNADPVKVVDPCMPRTKTSKARLETESDGRFWSGPICYLRVTAERIQASLIRAREIIELNGLAKPRVDQVVAAPPQRAAVAAVVAAVAPPKKIPESELYNVNLTDLKAMKAWCANNSAHPLRIFLERALTYIENHGCKLPEDDDGDGYAEQFGGVDGPNYDNLLTKAICGPKPSGMSDADYTMRNIEASKLAYRALFDMYMHSTDVQIGRNIDKHYLPALLKHCKQHRIEADPSYLF